MDRTGAKEQRRSCPFLCPAAAASLSEALTAVPVPPAVLAASVIAVSSASSAGRGIALTAVAMVSISPAVGWREAAAAASGQTANEIPDLPHGHTLHDLRGDVRVETL